MAPLYPTLIACSLLLAATAYGQSFCDNTALTCFNEPPDCTSEEDCDFTMTSEPISNNNATKFKVTGKSSGWTAIAFSAEQTMGDDDVIMCTWSGSNVELLDRYNDGRRNVAKTNSLINNGLDLVTGTYENGVIACEFDRQNIIQDPQHFALGPDFNFYLLFGTGPLQGDNPVRHEQNPWASDMPVNLTSGERISRATPMQPTQAPGDGVSMTTSTGTHLTVHSVQLHVFLGTVMMIAIAVNLV